jgi:Asp-tRNA(Asn)/Glu-tRNA(Gln) amidotransferase A subunit family amidase
LVDPMVANVRMAGGIVFAKTNTPEFGAGANTVNKVYGATRNPFDLTRSAAGSSGGTAVALATGMLPLATGTDYGGSLRLPASFNGIVGFRPSPGIVPHVNRSAPLSPWSVLGPMARTVADAYLLMQAQADRDKRDPFSGDDAHRLEAALTPVDLSSLRVAFSPDLGVTPIDHGIHASFERKIATFRSAFAASIDRSPDFGEDVHESFRILRDVHYMAAHRQRVEEHRDLLGPNVIANTEDGKQFALADVAWAMVEQGKIYKRFLSFFDDVDVLICPATSVTPYPLSDPFVRTINGQPMADYVRWAAITYALTTALPAAACITCGRDHEGMPFGLQVVGPNGSDAFIWRVAHTLEHVLATNPETARPVPDIDKLLQSVKGAT